MSDLDAIQVHIDTLKKSQDKLVTAFEKQVPVVVKIQTTLEQYIEDQKQTDENYKNLIKRVDKIEQRQWVLFPTSGGIGAGLGWLAHYFTSFLDRP